MRGRPVIGLLVGLLACFSTLQADDDGLDTRILGERVEAVREAIANPDSRGSLQAVRDLGLDSRYYVMVRGWLVQQLAGDEAIVHATGDSSPAAVTDRIEFLRAAIRAIDLE